MKIQRIWLFIVCTLLLTACSEHKNKPASTGQFAFLDSLGIDVDESLLLGDSLVLPDIYSGDPEQTLDDLKGTELTKEQYQSLIVPAGSNFADEMSLWLLLGVREVGNGNTMATYYAGNGLGYCVHLMTYDQQGRLLDAVNLRELHLIYRVYLDKPELDDAFAVNGFLTFSGNNGVTLHRSMERCMMDFDKDIKSDIKWRQDWTQDYTVNDKGYIVMHGQQVTSASGQVDSCSAMDFKSWDLLSCSQHDESIMDVWNDFVPVLEVNYPLGYRYNPFPNDVTQLYEMNPQRFLRWMAQKRDQDNNLLRYFKLRPAERPSLLKEIGQMDDESGRQWLTNIVNSWDDKSLTKHL